MPHAHRLFPQPIHQLVAEPGGGFRAEGPDPQFRLDGPFARGLWEFRFRGAAPDGSGHDGVRIYYAPDGHFTEAASVRFPGLGISETPHTLRFWLPIDAAWIRLDPSEAAGTLKLGPIDAVRRSTGLAILLGAMVRLRQSPGQALQDLRRIFSAAWSGDRHERNRLLIELALQTHDDGYERWLSHRMAARSAEYRAREEDGLFSLITTAFDTPAEYLQVLARSVLDQTWRDFEWVILDNGSSSAATRRVLARLAEEPRVRLSRVESNLGIIGGMRYVLERARNRYVVPVDSDDYLCPDALTTIASVMQRQGYPTLLYSDEDKLRGRTHTDPFFKPDWDPVLLRNCCYIAHLCAILREDAVRLGAYTDRAAEGCHDWDTFLRFVRAGHDAVHVPEILYSWRMHGASTAADAASKTYIVDSHRHVLERHVEATGIADRIEVVASPFFPASPDWWFRRRRVKPPPVALVIWLADASDSPAAVLSHLGEYPVTRVWITGRAALTVSASIPVDALSEIRHSFPRHPMTFVHEGLHAALLHASYSAPLLVALADTSVTPADEWVWEMVGLKEAFPDAVMVGGRQLDDHGVVSSAAGIFGLRNTIESPDRGRTEADPGYFGTALKQRSTDAVSASLCGLDPAFVSGGLARSADTPAQVAVAAALHARTDGRVVYSPFIEGRVLANRSAEGVQPSSGISVGSIIPSHTRYYHPLLSQDPAAYFRPRT